MVTRGKLILCLAALLAACAAPIVAPPVYETTSEGEWLAAYFSDPAGPGAPRLLGGPDEPLQAAIEAARVTIDVAIYDLNMNNLRNALIEASRRGVQVRMVVEGDNFNGEELAVFEQAGIQVVADLGSGLMHNKFVVVDRYEVWTGSLNYTISSAYGDRNNLVRLRSSQLAENFEMEFDELFAGQFGPSSPANTPHRSLSFNGTQIETYFAPEDHTLVHLLALVDGAEQRIDFLAYSFTADELAEALLAAAERGVQVRGVFDAGQSSNSGGEYGRLAAAGLAMRLDSEGGSLHDKVLIIDGATVVTGSYNFSANADRHNDENTLVIHNAELASAYLEEFERIWKLAAP